MNIDGAKASIDVAKQAIINKEWEKVTLIDILKTLIGWEIHSKKFKTSWDLRGTTTLRNCQKKVE